MATRLYLPYKTSSDAAVSPAISSGFSFFNSGIRTRCVTTKSSTALTNVTDSYDRNGISGNDVGTYIYRMFVSDQIGVVNFNGTTISAVLRCITASGNTVKLRIGVRLYHTDTTLTTLLTPADFDSNIGTSAATRIVNAQSLLNVSSQNNDRLVFEVGIDLTVAATSPADISERFGDNNASDFALTSGLTTDLNPWIEFSATIPGPSAAVNSGFFQLMK